MNNYTLVCCGNFANHYILALSKELKKVFKKYYFIVSDELPSERKKMGFSDLNDSEFVVKAYEDKEKARQLILDADIVITGSYRFEEHIKERLKQNKPVFFDSERLFKYNWLLNKLSALRNYIRHINSNNSLLLCISAYAPGDYNSFGAFKNRTYKWGYFPEPIKYDNVNKLISNKKTNSIIWAGRLISWKHPEYCIEVAKRLKDLNYNFEINIIGNGEMENELKEAITNNKLEDCVYMLGSMPPENVRKHMEESEIYLFTSDKGEGWGVVLNEAMNSICACVASYSTGSTPFLMKNNVNGLVYKNDNVDELFNNVKFLLDNDNKKKEFGLKAYEDIINVWNPKEAANRLEKFISDYLNGKDMNSLYNEDILSKALPIK